MALIDLFGEDSLAQGRQVRTEPIQQRSAARLTALLDAAAEVVDEVGFDRITTAMVAERAGASIGTVYRYYPDRVAVLEGLRERAVMRYRQRVSDLLKETQPSTWWEAVDCGISAFVDLYRAEPGFRILHFADRERAQASVPDELDSGFFANQIAGVLSEQFGLSGGPELIFRLEVAVEMADSLLSRAFTWNSQGDERFIAECRRIMHDYLVGFYGTES
ncbi:TetR/AcrR family transcriptional regulator [Cryobacterium arcticum]|uniref:TetR family transcriptional regulator n=1 Tax=Cryobacterium arcticum TaxID=670052 RepID=A0A1B1BJ55_9MICO|nr:TetR/AcrR family transcriptional regulator [Cryobacterium arcticum]ANP72558.1 TetR family transcriptional regulator [Cryobacterium arcticum]